MQLSEGVYYVRSAGGPVEVLYGSSPVQPPQEWDDEYWCYGLSGVIRSECFAATKYVGEVTYHVFSSTGQGVVFRDEDPVLSVSGWSASGIVAYVSPLGVHAIVVVDAPGDSVFDALPAAFGSYAMGHFCAPLVGPSDAFLLAVANQPLVVEIAHLPGTNWEYEPTPVSLSPQQVRCSGYDGSVQLLYDWGRSFSLGEV